MGNRSGLEDKVQSQLDEAGVTYEYETEVLKYPVPDRRYTPDFIIRTKSGKKVYIETKGHFPSSDRTKMKLVKKAHPELDIRIVFGGPNTKIGKKSDTTYAMWADRFGFLWAKGLIPQEWLEE